MNCRKAVFLDKDGTLINNVPYNIHPNLIQISDHLVSGLTRLKHAGYLLIVVTNQSGLAKGYFSERQLHVCLNTVKEIFYSNGIALDALYYCPHHPDGVNIKYSITCKCRKPEAGLIFDAAKDFNINLSDSWLIGDSMVDIEAGNKAGCKTILLRNGFEGSDNVLRTPYTIGSIDQAANHILSLK